MSKVTSNRAGAPRHPGGAARNGNLESEGRPNNVGTAAGIAVLASWQSSPNAAAAELN